MEYVGAILVLLVAPLVGVAALIAIFRPLPRIGLGTRQRAGLGCLGSIALVVVGFSLVMAFADLPEPTDTPPAQPAKNAADQVQARPRYPIKDADRLITKVERYEGNLFVTVKLENSWDDKGWLDGAAQVVERVARRLQRGSSDDQPRLERIVFSVSGPAIDRLGNEAEAELFNLTFSADDLRRANLDNLNTFRLIDLTAELSIASGLGHDVVQAWCSDDLRAREASSFCLDYLSQRGAL